MKLDYNSTELQEIKSGDTIYANGVKKIIDIIISQDYYKGNDYEIPAIDLEFIDSHGFYGHYKSWMDKGYILYK